MNRILSSKAPALLAAVVCCTITLGWPGRATAQAAASGPVEIIVPWGTGGGADQLARETAKLLQRALDTPAKVTNIPGRTGNAAMQKFLASPSDGRLLSVLTAETYCLLAYANPGWKPADVVPLAIMVRQPSAFFLPTSARFKSWSDFEKEARQKPRSLRVAISGLGSPDYLVLQQLSLKGVQLIPVPFENPEQRFQAVLNGQADALYEQPADVAALVQKQQLQPVLFLASARIPAFKDVPVSSELGYGNGLPQFRAIVVKVGTDPHRVKALSEALDRIAETPEYKAFLKDQLATDGSYIPAKSAPAFLQQAYKEMKQTVDTLPLHAQYIWEVQSVTEYIEPF
ncbi:MAG: tripartite tricarboxylate transporter substrate binding protein [Methylibium sp.]|nr:tripartite tricarboxylate transporter substrate binding protein [Methylibium sp.]